MAKIEDDVPYQQGWVAALDEQFTEAVDPYPVGSEQSARWNRGLEDGRHEARCLRGSE